MTPNVLGLGLTAFAQVSENGIDAIFIDQAQGGAGNAQTHPTVFPRQQQNQAPVPAEPAIPSFLGRERKPLGASARFQRRPAPDR